MKKLDSFRRQIDLVDEKIIILLKQRMLIVKKVGLWKKQNNVPALDGKRWNEVLRSKMLLAKKLGLKVDMIKDVYEIIHKYALEIETKL